MANIFCARWGIVLALLVVVLQSISGANLELYGGIFSSNCDAAPCTYCCDLTVSEKCNNGCTLYHNVCHWNSFFNQPGDCGMRYWGCPSPCISTIISCDCWGP